MLDKKTIEEIFDEEFNGYWRGRAIPDQLKQFINKTILQILDDVAGEEETFEDFENDKLHPAAVFKKGREEKRQEILDYKYKFK